MTRSDPLTKYICVLCAGKLDYFEKFRIDCQTAQISLRRKLYEKSDSFTRNEDSSGNSTDVEDDADGSSEESEIEELYPCTSKNVFDDKSHLNENSPNHSNKCSVTAVEILFESDENFNELKDEIIENDLDEEKCAEIEENYVCNERTLASVTNNKITDDLCTNDTVNCTNAARDVEVDVSVPEVMEMYAESSSSCYGDDVCNDDIEKEDYVSAADDANDETICDGLIKNDSQNSIPSSKLIVTELSGDNDNGCPQPDTNNGNKYPLLESSVSNNEDCGSCDDEESNYSPALLSHDKDDLQSSSAQPCKEINKSNVEMQKYASIGNLYFRLCDREQLTNDSDAISLKRFLCFQNLYDGKCSMMPYFLKWPLPDGKFKVGFKCIPCSKMFYKKPLIIEHIFDHLGSVCNLCKIYFQNQYNYKTHMNRHHFFDFKNGKVKCNFCGENPTSLDTYMKHQNSHCQYNCEYCSFKGVNPNEFKVHMNSCTMKSKICIDCLSSSYDDQFKLTSHILAITSKNGFVCKSCGIGFHCKDFLELHYEIYGFNHIGYNTTVNDDTKSSGWNLVASSSSSQNTSKLIKIPDRLEQSFQKKVLQLFNDILNKKIQFDQLPLTKTEECGKGTAFKFKCPVCRTESRNVQSLINHVSNHLLYACKRCPKFFPCTRRFVQHVKTKCKLTEFHCSICKNLTFRSLQEYMAHVRNHLGKKICPYCPQVCSNHEEKSRHISKMHKDEMEGFYCDQCGKKYVNYSRLKIHKESVHDDGVKNPNICPDCGKVTKTRFCRPCSRKKENNDGYTCAYCSKVFKGKTGLIAHINAHMNLQEFQCKFCNKGFNRQTSLGKHMKDAHSERKWNCLVGNCNKAFAYKSALETHVNNCHSLKLKRKKEKTKKEKKKTKRNVLQFI